MREFDPTPTLPAANDEALDANNGHLSRPHHHENTLLMKIIGPVITFVDRPWKVRAVLTLSKRNSKPQNLDVPGGCAVRFR